VNAVSWHLQSQERFPGRVDIAHPHHRDDPLMICPAHRFLPNPYPENRRAPWSPQCPQPRKAMVGWVHCALQSLRQPAGEGLSNNPRSPIARPPPSATHSHLNADKNTPSGAVALFRPGGQTDRLQIGWYLQQAPPIRRYRSAYHHQVLFPS